MSSRSTFRAKKVPENKWCQSVEARDGITATTYRTEIAARFGFSEMDLQVVETIWTTQQRIDANAEMAAGIHEGLGVVMAPVYDSAAQSMTERFDQDRLLRACLLTTLDAVNELRTNPQSILPAITPAAWRHAILKKYRTLS